MGKMALIIVVGLSMTVGIVGYTLNKSKTNLVENVSGFDKYTNARNIAHTGVNMMLRRLDRNDTSIINPMNRLGTPQMISSVMAGLCTVSIKLAHPPALDTVDLTSKARFMDTMKIMNLRLWRHPIPFPAIGEAVGLRVPDVNFDMNGTPNIDGHNHDINGNLLPPSADDKPGVGVLSQHDSGTVAPYGAGIDGTQDVVMDPGMSNPTDFVDDYINAADFVYNSAGSPYGSNLTWGSQSAPVIVYADGTGGGVKFTGTVVGWGILVVKGNLTLTGNFTFHGLVVAYNDVTVEQISLGAGTPTIIGGFLMGGADGSSFTMKGTDQINYSKDALELAKYINKLQVYRVQWWYE